MSCLSTTQLVRGRAGTGTQVFLALKPRLFQLHCTTTILLPASQVVLPSIPLSLKAQVHPASFQGTVIFLMLIFIMNSPN